MNVEINKENQTEYIKKLEDTNKAQEACIISFERGIPE